MCVQSPNHKQKHTHLFKSLKHSLAEDARPVSVNGALYGRLGKKLRSKRRVKTLACRTVSLHRSNAHLVRTAFERAAFRPAWSCRPLVRTSLECRRCREAGTLPPGVDDSQHQTALPIQCPPSSFLLRACRWLLYRKHSRLAVHEHELPLALHGSFER